MTTDKTPATLATVKHGGCVRLGTPGSRWAASGEPDPQGTRYDCERAALVMGDLTDDELANAVFMHGNERQTMADLVGGATPAIAYLTAAKDRIRWMSRALAAAESPSAHPSPGGQGDAREQFEEYRGGDCERDAQGYYTNPRTAQDWAMWQAALAARQPVGNEPAFYLSAGAWGHIRVPMTPTRDVKAFRHGFDHGDTELVPFYAAPPVQSAGEPMEMRICELRHVSLKPNRPYVFTIDANCANCRADAAYAMGHTDTKPAQAVDLGQQLRELLDGWKNSDYPLSYEGQHAQRALNACIKDLQGLIDSQVVGNG